MCLLQGENTCPAQCPMVQAENLEISIRTLFGCLEKYFVVDRKDEEAMRSFLLKMRDSIPSEHFVLKDLSGVSGAMQLDDEHILGFSSVTSGVVLSHIFLNWQTSLRSNCILLHRNWFEPGAESNIDGN